MIIAAICYAVIACVFAGLTMETWYRKGVWTSDLDIVLALLVGAVWPLFVLLSIGWHISKRA